jgi:predicted TPR repeat methyltransferase
VYPLEAAKFLAFVSIKGKMVMDFFDAYGVAASKLNSPILISGRGLFNDNVDSIVADVARKLEINSENIILEIGCGVGLLLTPLSRQVARAVGVDTNIVSRDIRSSVCQIMWN